MGRKHAVLPSPRLHRPQTLPLPYSNQSFFFTSSPHCIFPMTPALPRLFNSPFPPSSARLSHPISAWYPRYVTPHLTEPTIGHCKRVCSPKYRRTGGARALNDELSSILDFLGYNKRLNGHTSWQHRTNRESIVKACEGTILQLQKHHLRLQPQPWSFVLVHLSSLENDFGHEAKPHATWTDGHPAPRAKWFLSPR
jgi:hypothetical protein